MSQHNIIDGNVRSLATKVSKRQDQGEFTCSKPYQAMKRGPKKQEEKTASTGCPAKIAYDPTQDQPNGQLALGLSNL